MLGFKRKRLSDEDQAVVTSAGDQVHLVRHVCQVPDDSAAMASCRMVADRGYLVGLEGSNGTVLVLAEAERVVTSEYLRTSRAFFEEVAWRHGGSYVGPELRT